MFGDDYSNDMDTMATVTVDASGRNFEDFQNFLMRTDVSPESQTTDDVDWIRVALEAGATYEIVYDVKCLHRSIIEGIYDPDGNRVFDTHRKKGSPRTQWNNREFVYATSLPNSPHRVKTGTTTSPYPPKHPLS